MADIRETTIRIARGEVGTQEDPLGSNTGPRVNEYIRSVGLKPPVFWCACFLYWCVDHAANELGVTNPLPRTGSCDAILEWARRGGHLCNDPQPGDFFLHMASENDATHIGMVVKDNGSTIETIEGNSNAGGSNNGIEVAARPARPKAKLKFVRWAPLTSGAGYALMIGRKKIADMPLVEGVSYAPVREVVKALGFDDGLLVWDGEASTVRFNGDLFHAMAQIRGGAAFLPVRSIAGFFGLDVKVDDEKATVTLVRPS